VDREDEPVEGGWIDRRLVVKSALAFAIAVALVYLLGRVVGWDETIDLLRDAQLEWVALASLATLCSIVVWAKIWQVVLASLGVSVPFPKLLVTFYAATFANYVTPFGQTGGQPFVAYLLARDTEADYEQSLASVMTTDLLRMIPFFTAGGIGIAYLIVDRGLRGPMLRYAGALLVVAVAIPVGVFLAWRGRGTVRAGVLAALGPVARRTDRVSLESVRGRFERLYAAFGMIGDARRALLVGTGYAFAGWVLFVLPLYFSGLALGLSISLPLVAFLVPATVLVGAAPLPGGLGAIEGSLVGLLVLLTAVTAPEALAITTVYRLTSYWLVVVVGGAAALWVLKRV